MYYCKPSVVDYYALNIYRSGKNTWRSLGLEGEPADHNGFLKVKCKFFGHLSLKKCWSNA